MTKPEIANIIRDFSIDVENMRNADGAMIVKEMRAFADRVENEDDQKAPWKQNAPAEPGKPVGEAGTYLYGEER